MKTDSQSTSSIVPKAAQHERELLARLKDSVSEASTIVQDARDQARRKLQETVESNNQQSQQMRREAETKRRAAFDARIQRAESELTTARDTATSRVAQMTQDVLGLFVPQGDISR